MKIWEKYLLKKKRAELDKKLDKYKAKSISISNFKESAKAIRNTEKRNTLSKYISQQEIDKLTLKDFE